MDAARASRPAAVPSLADVQADPRLLAGLQVDVLVDLRRQMRLLDADVEAAITRHIIRTDQARPVNIGADRLLSPEEAAAEFGVTKRWLLEHANEIPGVRRLSRKTVRFSERALRRHLNGMRA